MTRRNPGRSVERVIEHVQGYEVEMSDEEFTSWLTELIALNVECLENLLEQQLRFFSSGTRLPRGESYGRGNRRDEEREREPMSIGFLIGDTRELQLELCDLVLLKTRVELNIRTRGFQSAANALRRGRD